MNKAKISVGDLVKSVNELYGVNAGVWATTTPFNGEYDNKREKAFVFKGPGKVIKTKDVLVDYGEWPDHELTTVCTQRHLLVECKGGVGWVGTGAVRRINHENKS